MNTSFISEHPSRIFAWTFGCLLLLLIIMEGWRYMVKPGLQNNETAITQKLEEAASLFIDEQQELLDVSRELANTLQSQIERGESQSKLYESLQNYPHLWGAGLFRLNQPVVWSDYSLDPFQEVRFSNEMDIYIDIKKQDNVIYWLCHIGFYLQTEDGEVPYHLYTAKRIQQTNALPFADEREYSILEKPSRKRTYSIELSIYNPLPDEKISYRPLKTLSEDSVGVVYATAPQGDEAINEWQSTNRFWRALFALLCFVIVSILLYYRVDTLPESKSLVIQLIIIGIGWLVFNYIAIAEYWIPTLFEGEREQTIASYQALCSFIVYGLFFLFTALTIHRKIKNQAFQFHSTWFLSSILASFLVGLINTAGIFFVFQRCYELALNTSIPLLTLQVFPGMATILLYIALGIILLALTLVLLAINQFLLRSCREQAKLAAAICAASFIISLFVAQVFISEAFMLNWAFIICIVYFTFIFAFSFVLFNFPLLMKRSSPLRNAAVGSLIISIVAGTLVYHAQMAGKDKELTEIKAAYSQQQNNEAEQLLTDILTQLGQEFRTLSEEDLQERISFIQARFTETIESILTGSEPLYSFDLQLIRPNLQLVADYSTDLNSPNWVKVFDLRRLEIVTNIQQITKNSVRPVVQQPELANAENYLTFYRGWIPIFGAGERDPIAWILCSVFRERPNFYKPMQAVMTSVNYEDWNKSFAIQHYQNNRLRQVIYQGVRNNYPVYNVLQAGEVNALEQDSTVFYTSVEDQNSYRNFLAGQAGGSVTKISTILPDYQNILFSFFRLSFTLLIAGFVLLMGYQFLKTGRIIFFGKNEQFQYRILDSFLLATLVFLIILVITTHFAIREQNRNLVQQQLREQLESITNATEQNPGIRQELAQGTAFSLDSLTAPLNVDASFYSNAVIKKSTTPQIYQQNLLPSALPFPVYRDLFQNQKRDALTSVKLDEQDLLIGYRSVIAADGTPVAAIAIPTFVQSPKYNRQLLETTSFLIILYLVVFGLFIIGTTFISRQLTRPLHHIRQGLNKLSRGDLDTTIPVTSTDEIGQLAIAYNQMVTRLKELQEDLAAAEREAAWQEMAQQVAHEIKNPLTPMKLNIQHLERQMASDDYDIAELKEKIQTITQNLIVQIQSLNNIASDFSKFSKPIDEEFTVIDINELVHSVMDLYKHDEEVEMTAILSASPATVYGTQDELRRVIINLVKNAREAMPDGGTINLLTFTKEESLFIEVEDDGTGIPEEDKPKIFVPNFSTKSSGTGLGLAICKKVIEAHEGSISFASIEGEGTTFVVKLPLHRG